MSAKILFLSSHQAFLNNFYSCKEVANGLYYLFLFVFWIFSSTILIGQNKTSSTQLLSNRIASELNGFQNEGLSFLKNSPQNLSAIEKMEFRTETDKFELEHQKYLFRLSLNGRKMQKTQAQLVQKNIQVYENQQSIYKQNELIEYYQFIADWYYLGKEIQGLNAKKAIIKDKKKVFEKLMNNNSELSLEDYLENEENLHKFNRDSIQLENAKSWILQKLGIESNAFAEIELERKGWISVSKMQTVIEQIGLNILQNPKYVLQLSKTNFAQSEFNLEEAEGKKIVDFVQLEYAENDKTTFQKELSIGLGFNIPIKFTNRTKLNEARLEIFEEEYKTQLLEQDLLKKIEAKYATFQAQFHEYNFLNAYINQNQLEETMAQHLDNPNVGLFLIFKVKEHSLKNKKELLEIEKNLCLIYLEILELSGVLGRDPIVNYLSEGLETVLN